MYPWLLFGHLLGVVLLVTGWGISVAAVDGFRRAQTVTQLRTLAGLTIVGERVLVAGGPLLIGFGLALAGKFYTFSHAWILAALVLVGVQGALGAAIVSPRAHRIQSALMATPDGPLREPLAANARNRILHVANRASIPLLIELEFLMTVKPAPMELALSLLVAMALAVGLSWPVAHDRPWRTPPIATTPRA
jgi:hypothetical protein